MVRKIITIDNEKCNGCGLCAKACHEGAIGIVDGKAKLLRDDYCDGLGNCLPVCPTGAISFEEREAKAYDESAVESRSNKDSSSIEAVKKNMEKNNQGDNFCQSELRQWPIQIKLAPVNASYFENADLLIAADCAAYAYGNFHADFIAGKITLIGCPKLDDVDYSVKLTEILSKNKIKSVTVVRMEVPCCGGVEHAVFTALKNSGRMIPRLVVTVSTKGALL